MEKESPVTKSEATSTKRGLGNEESKDRNIDQLSPPERQTSVDPLSPTSFTISSSQDESPVQSSLISCAAQPSEPQGNSSALPEDCFEFLLERTRKSPLHPSTEEQLSEQEMMGKIKQQLESTCSCETMDFETSGRQELTLPRCPPNDGRTKEERSDILCQIEADLKNWNRQKEESQSLSANTGQSSDGDRRLYLRQRILNFLHVDMGIKDKADKLAEDNHKGEGSPVTARESFIQKSRRLMCLYLCSPLFKKFDKNQVAFYKFLESQNIVTVSQLYQYLPSRCLIIKSQVPSSKQQVASNPAPHGPNQDKPA